MTNNANFYHRPDLAGHYAEQALDFSMGGGSGLFFAAPRRTGKSTFLRQDLEPSLIKKGAYVLMVDLWADTSQDPGTMIMAEIKTALTKKDGPVMRLAHSIGLKNFSIGVPGNSLTFDLSQLGLSSSATISDALSLLAMQSKQKIVFIIDEAQHALTTASGESALKALKAARDKLNQSADAEGFVVLATGSNKDKLSSLIISRDQAFFGANLIDFPPLGKGYIEWLIDTSGVPLHPEKTYQVFKDLSARPELILPTVREMRSEQRLAPINLAQIDDDFLQRTRYRMAMMRDAFFKIYTAMPALQREILTMLGERDIALAGVSGMFREETYELLRARVPASITVDQSAVQRSLEALRDQHFLWKSSRGVYGLEDDLVIRWIEELNEKHT